MSFWRFKLLEITVWGATGTALIPVVFGTGILLAQIFEPADELAVMIGLGAVWFIASLVLSTFLTAKLSKRRSP